MPRVNLNVMIHLVYLLFICVQNNVMNVIMKIITRNVTTIAVFISQLLYKGNEGSEKDIKKA